MRAVKKHDRRAASRQLDPSTCPECHERATHALFRTDTAVYYHCANCAHLWYTQKPVAPTVSDSPSHRVPRTRR
jgi:Zn ribbon nucleic-acid-binding protein